MSAARTLLAWLLILAMLPVATRGADPPATAPDAGGRRLALLVGCTRYPTLRWRKQLRGPVNDVILLRQLLLDQFGFRAEDMTVLVEQDHLDLALADPNFAPLHITGAIACDVPTDVNIAARFDELIRQVRPGDTVFILLSGHGGRQPDLDHDPALDSEPDGYDELFLPRNIGRWTAEIQAVEHAITDDQIRNWISAIIGNGAFVFFIADTCHSGTVTRGVPDDSEEDYDVRSRNVDADELGVPAPAPDVAAPLAGFQAEEADWLDAAQQAGGASGLAALYAVQSHQEAKEERPTDEQPHFGRLSYTCYEILSQCGQRISYRELSQRVIRKFENRNWINECTPGIEGTQLDGAVLGLEVWPDRSPLALLRNESRLTLNGGGLQGVTQGSILAVYPPAGTEHAEHVLGYVEVTASYPLSAVVAPVEWDSLPVAELPDLGRCEVVFRSLGDLQLDVAVLSDGFDDPQQAADRVEFVRGELDAAAAMPEALIRVSREGSARWVAVATPDGVYLQRASSPRFDWHDAAALSAARRRGDVFGRPYAYAERLQASLRADLERIARAENLRKLADAAPRTADPSVNVSLEITRQGQPFSPENLATSRVRTHDTLSIRITNAGTERIAVVVFYLDSNCGVTRFFPITRADRRNNEIGVGDALYREVSFTLGDDTVGWEHAVVIAVSARDQDTLQALLRLEQEALSGAATRGDAPEPHSPLARLINRSLGRSRGEPDSQDAPAPGSYAIRQLSWNIDG